MNIGIVTFEFNYNYGALLQAYSLVSCLQQLGHKVQIFNRGWGNWDDLNRPITLKQRIHNLIGRYVTLRGIENFRKRYLPLTVPIHSDKQLRNEARRFDLIIVGSDQIWSAGTVKAMGFYYFADFAIEAGIPVISYAASMGKGTFDVTFEQKENVRQLLSHYQAVSCRELQMIPILKQLGVKSPKCVLDPTLLADYDIFEKLTMGGGKKSHIVHYFLDKDKTRQEILSIVEAAFGTKSVNIYLPESNLPLFRSFYPSVATWLTKIKNARFVMTDSFHGMVFSIIFKRDFVVLANRQRGAARFESLLGQLGLENRIVATPGEAKRLCNTSIDYSVVSRRLLRLRQESLGFLSNNI